MPDFGVSLLTKRIYMGKSEPVSETDGARKWIGKKTDVTNGVLRAALEYMHLKAEKSGYYEIRIAGFGVMGFIRETTNA
jgi:hypothetical protein